MKKTFTLFICSLLVLPLFAQIEKVVLIEEGTGTWCQWCPRGDVYGQVLAEDYPNNALFIAVHSGDQMENEDYADASSFPALPNGNIDRVAVSGLQPDNMANDLAPRLNQTPPASVSVATSFEANTRELSMTLTAEFAESINGDYRLAGIVVEDGVTGPPPAYNQSNSYSGGAAGPMGGYEDLPSPVPATIMVYNHVGRHLAGGYTGEAGSLPNTITSGDSHSHTYTYTLPQEFDEAYVYVIGILVNATTGEVLNAGRSAYLPGYDNGKPFFHSQAQTMGFQGINYTYDILAHDPEHDNLTITNTSSLPPGLSLNDAGEGKATLSGIPNSLGTFEITLNVNDGEWDVEQTFDLTIGQPEEDWVQLGIPGFSQTDASNIDLEISNQGEAYLMVTNNDQIYLYKFENEEWVQQGTPLAGKTFYSSMALSPDNIPHIFSDGVVSKFNAGQWEQVGNKLPGQQFIFSDIIIATDGTPFVVYFAPPSTTNAYLFNGSDWELAGTLMDGVGVWNKFNLDDQGNPILIYGTDGANIAYSEVAQWDGSNWNLLGGAYVEPTSQTYFDHDIAVTSNGNVFAALTIGVGVQQLNIYQLVNGTWELIAEDLAGGATESCNLEADTEGNLIVAFRDENIGSRTSAMIFDGNEWSYLGLAGFTGIAAGQSLALDSNNIPFVAYRDAETSDKASVKKFKNLINGVFEPQIIDYYLKVYPNPNDGQFTLEYKKASHYQVIDVSGKVLTGGKLSPTLSQKIDLQNVPQGIYFVKVIGDKGVQVVKMWLK